MGVGVRSQESGVRSFRLCCPCFLYQLMYYKKDNARFLKVPILKVVKDSINPLKTKLTLILTISLLVFWLIVAKIYLLI
ncbi:MAG: hypothetical protein EWV91_06340 [Microcystis aeruginosa Ma_QC_Ca_00000000_S207]|uniref:Uncharacterized protein n=1 Tax=Microcystis aeruginosa Ma_QC_Ca_00000000_S207 TaxID=2486251 RepID=A0A552FU44_MICAE|nr:MAG: hypothetical protein EWV91_06340 [Microcystis aeruginosa Ma_QC_Ca_00000000_S207]